MLEIEMIAGELAYAERELRLRAPRLKVVSPYPAVGQASKCGDRARKRLFLGILIGFNNLQVGAQRRQENLEQFVVLQYDARDAVIAVNKLAREGRVV
jgi:hypothetical protein